MKLFITSLFTLFIFTLNPVFAASQGGNSNSSGQQVGNQTQLENQGDNTQNQVQVEEMTNVAKSGPSSPSSMMNNFAADSIHLMLQNEDLDQQLRNRLEVQQQHQVSVMNNLQAVEKTPQFIRNIFGTSSAKLDLLQQDYDQLQKNLAQLRDDHTNLVSTTQREFLSPVISDLEAQELELAQYIRTQRQAGFLNRILNLFR